MSHIVQSGLVREMSPLRAENFVNIGDRQIIQLRKERAIQGHILNEYIPFYLGPRSPMLYVIQHGFNGVARVEPEKIVYCVIRLDDLINNDVEVIFTDGHPLNTLTSFYAKESLPIIDDIVNYEDVYSMQWNLENDLDLKRRKEAELLVKQDLPSSYIRGFIVYNDIAKQTLIELGIDPNKIIVSANYYF